MLRTKVEQKSLQGIYFSDNTSRRSTSLFLYISTSSRYRIPTNTVNIVYRSRFPELQSVECWLSPFISLYIKSYTQQASHKTWSINIHFSL